MTTRDRLRKNGLFFSVATYYLGGFFLLNWATSFRKDLHHPVLPWEAHIPFVPSFIFAYLLVYFFLGLAYLAVDDLDYFRKMVKSLALCITIHFVIFLAFPVEYNLRPVVDPDKGWVHLAVTYYYFIDLPYNAFPSMHVSNAFLISYFMTRWRPGWGWFLFPLAILLSVSVVFVKQHYIADVLSGTLVGWFCFRQVFGRSAGGGP